MTNEAEAYGVEIERVAPLPISDFVWRVGSVRHLNPAQNMGRHNVFINAWDEKGNSMRHSDLKVRWGWEGQRPDESSPPVAFDKSDPNYMADIPIFPGQRMWIEIMDGNRVSDRVTNMHTNHPDEDIGNTRGHHSFSVGFLRERVSAQQPTPPDPVPQPSELPVPKHIYGVHDRQGSVLLNRNGVGGWATDTVHVWNDEPYDYRSILQSGVVPIVRLNNGYGSEGTIPTRDKYHQFAVQCANHVRRTAGCHRWIIGNEPNLSVEWPQGQRIEPGDYIVCFTQCRNQIKAVPGHEKDEVIIAAIGPWNVESGDWISYFRSILHSIDCDGIALHTYTHGSDPSLIFSQQTMDPPYQGRFYHFLAYMDFMDAIPSQHKGKPVYITETDQDDAWVDINSKWVQYAYREIDSWNKIVTNQPILALCLYRWQPYDKYNLDDKNQVHMDFSFAAKMRYLVPKGTPSPVPVPPPTDPPIDLFQRSLNFVLSQEGGWADNPADPGGATMKGITIGTYTNWRLSHGQPVPTKEDLRNISDAEVWQIYHDWYWQPSGAQNLPWPNCLAVFDLAVNGGVGRAQQFIHEVGTDFLAFNARRLEWYTRINGWPTFGAAWTRRVAALMKEAEKEKI